MCTQIMQSIGNNESKIKFINSIFLKMLKDNYVNQIW